MHVPIRGHEGFPTDLPYAYVKETDGKPHQEEHRLDGSASIWIQSFIK